MNKIIIILISYFSLSGCEKKDFNWDLPKENSVGQNNVNSKSYTITTTSNPIIAGITTGAGIYKYGDNVFVNATANSGWKFNNWTENGNSISTNSTYNFSVGGDRILIANFINTPGPINFTKYSLVCDNDGKIGKSEVVELKVYLKNNGLISVSDIRVKLTSSSSYVSFYPDDNKEITFGSMNAGQESIGHFRQASSIGCSSETISMSIGTFQSTPTGTIIFNLIIVDSNSNQWSDSFTITVQ